MKMLIFQADHTTYSNLKDILRRGESCTFCGVKENQNSPKSHRYPYFSPFVSALLIVCYISQFFHGMFSRQIFPGWLWRQQFAYPRNLQLAKYTAKNHGSVVALFFFTIETIGGGRIFQRLFLSPEKGENDQKGDLECALFCGIQRGNPHFLFHFSMCRYVTHYMM